MHRALLRHTLILAVVSIASSVSAFWTENDNNTNNQPQQWSSYFQQRQAGACGTGEPSPALRDAHKRLSSTEYRQVVVGDGDSSSNASSRPPVDSLPRIQVDTWFHVVSTSDQADLVTNAMIADQFVYLQQAYANTSIHYTLRGVDRSINDTWARNGDALAMKRTLRRGSYSALNIYFQTNLEMSDPSGVNSRNAMNHNRNAVTKFPRDQEPHYSSSSASSSAPNLLGFCTLPNPQINSSSTLDDYISDGCNILAATMPGGSITHYNRGGTAVHEVGHWHGLLHTFQDETCAPGDEGDYIPDTPQQSTPTDGCPAPGTKDSCPDLPGLDAISNFMDYSSDDCYQNFTYDQAMRMRSMWSAMREGK
ncbi:Extracellular metalloprotease [Talaromyces atroroseus]|uniref:Extracellular metalloprotease n=1 Tax=Talaromyces atroroseus TaxID=1441469 RepID=A0A225ADU6_TALAT|nr:Extracellular metalloprotease [Talaromyces atroroseus]OKL57173.1 Extracellular metalloprotease [Talaromyces atroroseus]